MKKTRIIAKLGVLLALACALQFLESLVPVPLPLGVKPGISSIVVMYILLFMGFKYAAVSAVLKSCFVLITRGASAFCMSLAGGLFSVAVMGVFVWLSKCRDKSTGIAALSVAGGVAHNTGQLAAASIIAGSIYIVSYLPVLIPAGVISGLFTGVIFRLLLPVMEKSAVMNENIKTAERS